MKMAIKGLKESDGTFLFQRAMEPHLKRVLALAEFFPGVTQEQKSALALLLQNKQKPGQLAEGDSEIHDQEEQKPPQRAEGDGEIHVEEKHRPKQLAEGDREMHVKKYTFKSNNVIELLTELQRKFENDLLAATKEEANAVNAHALAKQASDAARAAAEKSKGKNRQRWQTRLQTTPHTKLIW